MALTLHDGGGRQTVSKSANPLIADDRRVLVPDLVAGADATLRRNYFVVPIYWTAMFFLIVGLIIFMDFTTFVILVTKDAARKEFSTKGCS
ncbi:hypothetical protein SLEP1_g20646 [Rubroshorea leprosula]|uniref:Uncharacterized protein n=1 Tax=Rubroshorea leprosula TaxID=152421 RepID=A0AAV5JFB6_9ROSI|nr:hypothetical protein SLEP1_g20646 [Rubroshorea leprosula]